MHTPGFNAEMAVYKTQRNYAATSSRGEWRQQLQGPVSDAIVPSFWAPALGSPGYLGMTTSHFDTHRADARQTVFPASELGHQSDPGDSSQCNNCTNECIAVAEGCLAAGFTGCGALLAVPFAGPFLAAACAAAVTAGCYEAGANCADNCWNIGSACCPVDCGSGCCDRGETCLDSRQGLCCSRGLQPCRGPQESCYDPTKETCLPSGVGCAVGQECGENCCGDYAECVNRDTGLCCPTLTNIPCGTDCCNGTTERCTDTGCCPVTQACGTVCCLPGFVCGPNGQCVVGKTCQPGQSLCVSPDKTTQTCCAGDQTCCDDGSCCGGASQPYNVCCQARGCIPSYDCY